MMGDKIIGLMKYIVCEAPGRLVRKERAAPTCGEGEALLRVEAIGICGTDLHAYAGNQAYFNYPRILGHELAATVLEVAPGVSQVKPGDKVAVMPYQHCGHCIACRMGKTNCCTKMQVLGVHIDGGMQETIAVAANLLLPVNDLGFRQIALIEPLAIGAHALRRAAVEAGEKVVVMGCGPIGLGLMKLAKLQGAEVVAIDTVEERLRFAKEKIGVDHIAHAGQNPVEAVAQFTDGDLATAVFDATGNRRALESGPDYMSNGGRYVLVGLSNGELCFRHPAIHAKEISLLCSRNATLQDFQQVIGLLQAGLFPCDDYVTHTVAFDEMIGQFDAWLDPANGVIKAMVLNA